MAYNIVGMAEETDSTIQEQVLNLEYRADCQGNAGSSMETKPLAPALQKAP